MTSLHPSSVRIPVSVRRDCRTLSKDRWPLPGLPKRMQVEVVAGAGGAPRMKIFDLSSQAMSPQASSTSGSAQKVDSSVVV